MKPIDAAAAPALRYGFNMLWMYSLAGMKSPRPADVRVAETELDFICGMGCNFIRLPVDYRFWIRDFRYAEPDESMLVRLDDCVRAVVSRGLHCSLNLHRAPGYCINGAETEKHNLWCDRVAQDAFVQLWTDLALRYAPYGPEQLSFDLLNEPPRIGRYGMTRAVHEKLMRRTMSAVRAVSPLRPVVLNGIDGGNEAIPELADTGAILSTRGYQPMALTHYRAPWCEETAGCTPPVYPGTEWNGTRWNRETLLAHYAPWKTLADAGACVHVGECGCYTKTDNEAALAWFADLFSVFRELGWGYALWNFNGDFGICGHGRGGTRWEKRGGFTVDRDLYELFISGMRT